MEHESDSITNWNWCAWNNAQKLDKGARNQRMSREHLNYTIVEIGQNTEKSPGDLM